MNVFFADFRWRLSGLIALVFLLQGCFPGFKEEKQQDHDYEKIQKLQQNYANYVGTYEGDLVTVDRTIPMVLNMVLGQVQNGYYSDGSQKFLPTMNVSFNRVDAPVEPTKLTGNITDPELGADTFGTFTYVQDNTNPNSLQISTIRGKFESTHFTGTITTLIGQELGKFDLLKSSQAQQAPTEGATQEYYRKLEKELQILVGTWYTKAEFESGALKGLEVQIDLQIEKSVVNNVPDYPTLAGKLHRIDKEDVARAVEQNVTVTFDRTRSPPRFTLNGKSWKDSSPYKVNIYGDFDDGGGVPENQKVIGQWQDSQHNFASIVLTRKRTSKKPGSETPPKKTKKPSSKTKKN